MLLNAPNKPEEVNRGDPVEKQVETLQKNIQQLWNKMDYASNPSTSPLLAEHPISKLNHDRIVYSNQKGEVSSVTDLSNWVRGTKNQIVAKPDKGRATLSLANNITIAGAITATSVTVTGLTANRLVATNGASTLTSVANLANWIAGTANRVTVANDGDGTVTLSAPQDIHTGASPNFANMNVTGVYRIGGVTVLQTTATNILRVGPTGNSTTGNHTTLVGTSVLNSNSSGSTIKNTLVGSTIASNATAAFYECVMVGYNIANHANYAGFRNVFIGSGIGNNINGVAQGNVGIGNTCLASLTTGDSNFALGENSLFSVTTASGCVSIGQSCLVNNNASNVVAIGRDAGKDGINALECVIIGYAAGQNTNARRNVCIGSWSARWSSGGQFNFFGGYRVAYGSGFYNSYRNVIIGTEAFFGITSANDDNLVLGYRAEYAGGVSDSVILGPYSGFRNITSSRLVIDNQDRGSAANEVLNSLIHGDFNATSSNQVLRLNANVLIRYDTTQSPGTKCDGHIKRTIQEIQTTDAVQTTLDSITLEDENTYHAKGVVVGVKSDGTDRASYEVDVTVYRTGGGGATIQGAVTVIHSQESNAAWDATFTVNGNDLRLSVTGVAATTIEWGGFIQYMNMSN